MISDFVITKQTGYLYMYDDSGGKLYLLMGE